MSSCRSQPNSVYFNSGIYSKTGCNILNYIINAICIQRHKKHGNFFPKRTAVDIISFKMLFMHDYMNPNGAVLKFIARCTDEYPDIGLVHLESFKTGFMKHGLSHIRRYVIHNLFKYKSYQDAVNDAKAGKIVLLNTFDGSYIENTHYVDIDLKAVLILLDIIAGHDLSIWDSKDVNRIAGRPLNPIEYESMQTIIDELNKEESYSRSLNLKQQLNAMHITIENSF